MKSKSIESNLAQITPGIEVPEMSSSFSREDVESLRDELQDDEQSSLSQKGISQEIGASSQLAANIETTDPIAYDLQDIVEKEREVKAMIFQTLRQKTGKLTGWQAQLPSDERRRQIYELSVVLG